MSPTEICSLFHNNRIASINGWITDITILIFSDMQDMINSWHPPEINMWGINSIELRRYCELTAAIYWAG